MLVGMVAYFDLATRGNIATFYHEKDRDSHDLNTDRLHRFV